MRHSKSNKFKIDKQNLHRISLYIRVSTEEQANNPEGSIKSQEQRLRTHVQFKNMEKPWGEITNVFIDKAKSGKDTNRPELQRLLKSVVKGETTLVMCTELSRLSRNIKDFCDIWDLMREHGCEFQSLREQFDTTTAAGEMVLMSLANIAQFERKQVSERVRYNLRARSERGLFNGGCIPLGYKKDPNKKGSLIIDESESEIVQEIFNTFLREQTLAKTGKALSEKGIRLPRIRSNGGVPRSGLITKDNLYRILTQRMYIAEKKVEKENETTYVKAVWPPIIEKTDFEKIQKILAKNCHHPQSRLDQRFPFLFSGLVSCAKCGNSLIGKSAHGNGGKIPYYEHGWATKKQGYLNKKIFNCEPHRINASKLEPLVWEKIVALLTNPSTGSKILANAKKRINSNPHLAEKEKLQKTIKGVSDQIEALAEHLAAIPKGVSPEPIFKQMHRLEEMKAGFEEKLSDLRSQSEAGEVPSTLKDFSSFCILIKRNLDAVKDADLRNQILKKLVHKVEVTPNSFKIHYFVGEHTVQDLTENLERNSEFTVAKNKKPEVDFAASGLKSVFGSNRVANGVTDGA